MPRAKPASAIPATVNFIAQGEGAPVILVHGIAASLHAWDPLLPELVRAGYSAYALDLLGHGDSPKPDSRLYEMEWLFDALAGWIDSLRLTRPPVLIGHSLGGYLALQYASCFPARLRGLVLVDPLYSVAQLPPGLRLLYRYPIFRSLVSSRTPQSLFRLMVDVSSIAMGRGGSSMHSLPPAIRARMALDYARTAPGVYSLPSSSADLTPRLASVSVNSLVIWGEHDQTLAPSSFPRLVAALPRAKGESIWAGHVPQLTHTDWFNTLVLQFIQNL